MSIRLATANNSDAVVAYINSLRKESLNSFTELEKTSELLEQHLQREPKDNTDDWNLSRLAMLSGLAAVGTIGNIFAIAAVMTDDQLQKKGNVLIANLMLAGLLITAFVLPAEVVALLAGSFPPSPACVAKWWLTSVAAHTSLITLPCQAWENKLRVAGRPMQGTTLAVIFTTTWLISLSLTGAEWLNGIGPSHCEAKHSFDENAHKIFTGVVGSSLVLAPLVIALAVHTRTLLTAHSNVRPQRRSGSLPIVSGDYRPVASSSKELALPAVNLAVTAIAGSCWVIGISCDWWAADSRKRTLMWFPFGAAIASGFIYGCHKPFREAYVQLFHYCCCKTSVSVSRRGRGDASSAAAAAAASARPTSDVRVHIIPGYNMYSTSASREHRAINFKPTRYKERRSKVAHKNEVYEL